MDAAQPILDRRTLLGLRWAGTLALALVLAAGAAGWLPATPLPAALGILAAAAVLNAALHRFGLPATGPVLLADVGVITWMLASSGGAANPFTLLYLFPVLLASLVLSIPWTAALAALTTAAFAALWVFSPAHHHMDMSTHLVGMVVAYGLTVPIVAAAVHRFRSATADAEREAAEARQSIAAAERLASLAALAGGAAHELATPLSTILLIARELERKAEGDARADLAEIAEEVERCREILDQLALDVGTGAGQRWSPVDIDALVRGAVGDLGVAIEVEPAQTELPEGLVSQALRRLVGNARDAAGPDGRIVVRARCTDDGVRFEVEDSGPGMPPEVLRRAVEPFFTTKPTGHGRGLGLFFVHSLAHQLDGSLELDSAPGAGTVAILTLPGGRPCQT